MQPHQERVVEEQRDLSDKIEKLSNFEAGAVFRTLPWEEQDRLRAQLSFMKEYDRVLRQRIAWFKESAVA